MHQFMHDSNTHRATRRGMSGAGAVRFLAALLAVTVLCMAAAGPAEARNKKYASLVLDAETGLILHERYADSQRHPASLAKIMTLIMAFEALEEGRLGLRDRIPISRHANSMVPSKLNLPVGAGIRVDDAIYALVTKSANDVAAALAEKIGGTESNFAQMMTRKAWQIGMKQTRFRNASGLHDPRQVTTARDMGKMAMYLLNTYPDYYHYFATRRFTYRGKTYRNHNRLLESYKGMDGIKTGYIGASGFNLIASARRDGRRIIGIVFGGRSSRTRNAHMEDLLDRGFNRLNRIVTAAAKAAPVPPRKPERAYQVAALKPSVGREVRKAAQAGLRWADLNPIMQSRSFMRIIGQGDFDPAETRRLETGLLAIAAVKGELGAPGKAHENTARPEPDLKPWGIQVGAFNSRIKTESVIKEALGELPYELGQGMAVIVPLKTRNGWLFRGRLQGYTKDEAERACRYLSDCLPVAP